MPEAGDVPYHLRDYVQRCGFLSLPITAEHAECAGFLPGSHRDPFDRMLIAQAQCEAMALLTTDSAFDAYDFQRPL